MDMTSRQNLYTNRRSSKCKGPELGIKLACLGCRKKPNLAEVESLKRLQRFLTVDGSRQNPEMAPKISHRKWPFPLYSVIVPLVHDV